MAIRPAKKRYEHADLAKPEYRAWVRFLEESEHWSAGQIEQYEFEQVQKLVRHAFENTSGYRASMQRSEVTPADLRTLDDIRRLPFVTKEDMRDELDSFSAPWPERVRVTTGGSTGIPFGFYRDSTAFARELASKAHQYHRVGWREGDRQLVLRGLPISAADHMEYVPDFEELRCSSYHLTPDYMQRFYERALEYQPQWLRCYPSSGHVFAHFLDERGLRLPSVRGVLCASENLYDFQHTLLQKVFGPRIFSHYGHFELAALAGFCEYQSTYHVLPQYGYVELLGTDGEPVTMPGAMGEIVATSFLMYATPFIRYRTRDFAVLKSFGCPACGRPYQVWERIEGRLQEFVQTRTGRLISMTAINMHDGTFDGVQQFQFHQAEAGKLTLRYVPRASCAAAALAFMQRRLTQKFGDDVELRLKAVSEIPPTGRGKHRFLIQELKLEFGDA